MLRDETMKPSRRSLLALDTHYFVLSDVRGGLKPFLAVYLAAAHHMVVEDAAERGQALRLLDDKYPQYAKARPTGPVVAIDVARWSWWSAT